MLLCIRHYAKAGDTKKARKKQSFLLKKACIRLEKRNANNEVQTKYTQDELEVIADGRLWQAEERGETSCRGRILAEI